MLHLTNIHKSSELSSTDIEIQKITNESKISKRKSDVSSHIVKNFLDTILDDTLMLDVPKQVYEFDVDADLEVKDIQVVIDNIMYRIFKKNLYALPNVFYTEPNDANPIGKIIIHAPNTVKCFTSSDLRIEHNITEFIEAHIEVLKSGNDIVYTEFSHLTNVLPDAYAKSRAYEIQRILQELGYFSIVDECSLYFTISVSDLNDLR